MRRIRLFTAAALAGLGLVPAAAGTAEAASHPEVSMWSENWGQSIKKIYAACPDGQDLSSGGVEYVINAAGVHLRSTPGGKWVAAIARGQHFESDWFVNDSLYQCTAPASGKDWLIGISPAGQVGWVQAGDLTMVGVMHPDPNG